MCYKNIYLLCDCEQIHFCTQAQISCGHSGFESENDGTMCYGCEERDNFYTIIHNFLTECPDCKGKIEYKTGEFTVQNVEKNIIEEFNNGEIPPQTFRFNDLKFLVKSIT